MQTETEKPTERAPRPPEIKGGPLDGLKVVFEPDDEEDDDCDCGELIVLTPKEFQMLAITGMVQKGPFCIKRETETDGGN